MTKRKQMLIDDPAAAKLAVQALTEAEDLFDRYVDPAEAFEGPDGERWLPAGITANPYERTRSAQQIYRTEAELTDVRAIGRWLYDFNPFGQCAIENRVNYIVGYGHQYTVTRRQGADLAPEIVAQVQQIVDEFCEVNDWHDRQQENVQRRDCDGECFLRFFPDADDGVLHVRYVEPEHVSTPPHLTADRCSAFGVQTKPADIETVEGFWVKYFQDEPHEFVSASQMQHRKRNVGRVIPRGVPSLYAPREYLRGAAKSLRNVRTTVNIQTAIALIRKHMAGTKDTVQQMLDRNKEATKTNPRTGRAVNVQRYPAGSILDAPGNIEYTFPASGIQVDKNVGAIQADLRAAAAALVMPEYMLTSDASNANYASTLVAESPAVRNFERLQWNEIGFDRRVIMLAIRHAITCNRLPENVDRQIQIDVTAPSLVVRDPLQEEQCRQIRRADRVESIETSQLAAGLDPAVEKVRLAAQAEATPDSPMLPDMGSMVAHGE